MTKQELINAYQAELDKRIDMAKFDIKRLRTGVDEEEACHIEGMIGEHKLIASMFRAFIKNLKELE